LGALSMVITLGACSTVITLVVSSMFITSEILSTVIPLSVLLFLLLFCRYFCFTIKLVPVLISHFALVCMRLMYFVSLLNFG
jgi:hypothetical protein